jgi:hypothetical protein
MHHRLGHRSIESPLLGNSDNICNDVTMQKDPETVCKTCQITLAHRAARKCIHPDTYPTTPGTMVMVDIISNPFDFGFTLFVDVFSPPDSATLPHHVLSNGGPIYCFTVETQSLQLATHQGQCLYSIHECSLHLVL